MNQNYAVIENGQVVNVVVFDPEPKAPENWVRSDEAKIGDSWDGKVFSSPPIVEQPRPAPDKIDLLLGALIKKGVIAPADLESISAQAVEK